MDINHLDKEIDELFKSFEKQLDENNFGLYIDPQPLNPKDHVSVEEEDEDPKELDFNCLTF
tara:strand:- start:9357 stop:9539 length:183 start_codon:yes stop_codon:yes gene_type:complete